MFIHYKNEDDPEDIWGIDFDRITIDELNDERLLEILKEHTGGKAVRTHSKKRGSSELQKYFNVSQIQGGKFPLSYNQIYCGFDIETTQIDHDRTFMYTWQFSIFNTVIHGTTWKEFIDLMSLLKKHLWTGRKGNKLLVFVANLGYEWQFMKRYLNVTDFFFKEKREPVYVEHDDFIQFRECLSWGRSLSKLAEDYTSLRKLKGDLDYSIYRESYDDFTNEEEWLYCDLDVLILSQFSEWFFENYLNNRINPVTIQSFLRIESRREIGRSGLSEKKVEKFIRFSQLNEEDYSILMNWVYRGGYVHGNILHIGQEYQNMFNLYSVDFTSSYPASMLHYRYPMRFTYYSMYGIDELATVDPENETFYACFEFTNIRTKTAHTIESFSKCLICDDYTLDNGRVRTASKMRVYLTSLDWELYQLYYDWDEVECWDVHISELHPLPDYLLVPLLKYYTSKAEKKKEGINYAVEKSYCNSYYGVCVTRKVMKEVEWNGIDAVEKSGKSYNQLIKGDIFLPQWGVWISAYSRYNLLKNVHDIEHQPRINGNKNVVLYCDTDSIKFIDAGNGFEVIERYNQKMFEMNEKLCEKYHLNYEFYSDLGAFDNEYPDGIIDFKMLGAKRYIHSYMKDGKKKWCSTIAGLPKNLYAQMHCQGADDFLSNFVDKLDVKECKLAATYIDDMQTYIDRQGHIQKIESCVNLNEVDFTMKLDPTWILAIYETISGKYECRIKG